MSVAGVQAVHAMRANNLSGDQRRSQGLEVGGTEGLGDGSPPAGSRCRGITDIWLPDMHNFVYLSKVHKPLVKHEKNLGCSACLFAELSSNCNTGILNA